MATGLKKCPALGGAGESVNIRDCQLLRWEIQDSSKDKGPGFLLGCAHLGQLRQYLICGLESKWFD